MRRAAWLLIPFALAACSDGQSVHAGSGDSDPADGRVRGAGTVLESTEHGPQLCLGGVMDSLPPQCSGPDITNWDWTEVDDEESANGTTWGYYEVIGTYEDDTFTLTDPPAVPEPGDDAPETESSTPCDPPAGGWTVVDPATATEAAQSAAMTAAQGAADFSGLWVDQSINPASADGIDPGDEMLMNDSTKLVLNVRFTGDIAQHETELRALWGGALCVSEGKHTEAELVHIQEELGETPGMLWSSTDTIGDRVELGVIVDDGLQAELDARYGAGVVDVQPALTPL